MAAGDAATAAATRGGALEQARHQKQRDHRDTEAQIRQGKLRQQRNGALTGPAQITAHTDRAVEPRVHQRAAVEAVCGQRLLGLTLRTVVGPVAIGVGDLFGILLDGASEGV